jgi:hypothetical protein
VARQHIAATAVTAREALGEVREVATRYRDVPWPEAAPADPGELPAPRIARAVLVVALCGLAAVYPLFVAVDDLGVPGGYGTPVVVLTMADAVALVVLQGWAASRAAQSSTALCSGIRPFGCAGALDAGPHSRSHQRALRLPPARTGRAPGG